MQNQTDDHRPQRPENDQTERLYRLLFDAMQEGFALAEIIVDPSGKPYDYRVLALNPAAGRLTGFAPESIIGKTAREVLPFLKQEYIDILGRVALSGESEQFEMRSQALGKCYYVHAFCPERGKFACTFIDITERKRMEAALQERGQRFRALFEHSQDAVLLTIPDGAIEVANPAACAMFGHSEQEICALGRDGILDAGDPRLALALAERQKAGQIKAAELTAIRKGGKRFTVEVDSVILPDEPAWSFVILRDITARKKAEAHSRESQEQYRLALEATQLGTWIYDLPTGAITWDQRSREIYGLLPDEAIDVKKFMSLVHPDDRNFVNAALADSLIRPEKAADVQVEFRILRRDGKIRWAHATGKAHVLNVDSEQSQVRVIGTIMDITERKRNEQLLREMNDALEQKVAERSRLAENRARQLQALSVELIEVEERERRQIAHLLHEDLQQMLAAARMQLHAVSEILPYEPMVQNVGQILDESISKTRQLSHDLSPVALHHSGLYSGLQWLADKMKNQFGLEVRLEAEESIEVEGVLKLFLFRAVQELLFNIIKHAGVKTAHVRLARSGSDLSISVSDSGEGFAPDEQAALSHTTGFGLLSICERANYFGGKLTIDSARGKGSRFSLKIPSNIVRGKEPVETSTCIARNGTPPSGEFAVEGEGGLRVLFVDDHHVMRQGLIKLVTGQPDIHVVGEAASGEEALALVRNLKPDVVVMDVSMPGIGGVEATRRIKSQGGGVHVIGLSMHDDRHIIRTMRAAGADAFISKTVSAAELVKAIYKFR